MSVRKLYLCFEKYRWLLPPSARAFLRGRIAMNGYDSYLWQKANPYLNSAAVHFFAKSPFVAGIILNKMQFHRHWISACHDMGISYRLVDIVRHDWIERLAESKCDIYLVWPDISSVEQKEMFDERLRIMDTYLGCHIYPSLLENWLYENKRAQHYWLKSHNIPHPETNIFYNPDEVREFLKTAKLPIVFKSNIDASASGVYILRDRRSAMKMADQCFRKGVPLKRRNPNKRQRGSVYFQKYLPDVKEWRMVRIGHSFFGHDKVRSGDFHSGSNSANWNPPPAAAFDLLKLVTDLGPFTSMDVDIFETTDGRLLVNEMQSLFGNRIAKEQMKINGEPGRCLFVNGQYQFQAGSFCANHLCNLRLEYLIQIFKSACKTDKASGV